MTRFLLYSRNVPVEILQSRVPPNYHNSLLPLSGWQEVGLNELLWEQTLEADWLPSISRIIPCCSAICSADYGFQFSMRGLTAAGQSCDWQMLARIGTRNKEQGARGEGAIEAEIDQFFLKEPFQRITIRLLVSTSDRNALRNAACLVSLAFTDDDIEPGNVPKSNIDLPVPPKSQRREDPSIQNVICSPTCISMLLDYFGQTTTVAEVARRTYHEAEGIYGIWPANIWAASYWRTAGYLLRFSRWSEVAYLLGQGIPIVASVAYEEGELTDAAIEHTDGHLLVLRGLEPGHILVSDPASYEPKRVKRTYRCEDVEQIWLTRRGLGYVLFPAGNNT